jgi:hypothetical protein
MGIPLFSSKSQAQNAQLKSKIEEAVFFGANEEVGIRCDPFGNWHVKLNPAICRIRYRSNYTSASKDHYNMLPRKSQKPWWRAVSD